MFSSAMFSKVGTAHCLRQVIVPGCRPWQGRCSQLVSPTGRSNCTRRDFQSASEVWMDGTDEWGDDAKPFFRPKRIFIMRHGESVGNVDPKHYTSIPDNQLPMTTKGYRQAEAAGVQIRSLIPPHERTVFYVSPYIRTWETYDRIVKNFDDRLVVTREEPRLREQDFGNFQKLDAISRCRQERRAFGTFYYRFPQGESGADVYDRVSTFIEELNREWDRSDNPQNCILISHGLTARLFLMRFFMWRVEKFQRTANLENGQVITLTLQPNGKYLSDTELPEKDEVPPPKGAEDQLEQ